MRGAWRLESLLANPRWEQALVRTELGPGVSFDFPLEYGRTHYNLMNLKAYEHALIRYVSAVLAHYSEPFTLLDCGADIGLLSARLVAESWNLRRVIAFEPNSQAFGFLKNNLALLPCTARAHSAAVANFDGRGRLRLPDFDPSKHACFIEPDPSGAIEVLRIDALQLEPEINLLFKIDVEGGELDVLRGAEHTLRAAREVVVVFEAHPRQSARVGIDPVEIIQYLRSLIGRPLEVTVVEAPDLTVNLDRPLWSQSVPSGVLNICVYSRPA